MSASIPRPEYPKPQFQREKWINLNGTWTFDFDFGESGYTRQLFKQETFSQNITVPFCPESELSGVAHHDFIPALWYQRSLDIPSEWEGEMIFLHFGAVDYEAAIYIDGEFVGRHYGGSASFHFDISRWVQAGHCHNLVVHVVDDVRSGLQASGKQSSLYHSHRCFYTRVTGIWQTVWMEAVAPCGLQSCIIRPDIDNETCSLLPSFHNLKQGLRLKATVSLEGEPVTSAESTAGNGTILQLPIPKPSLWSPEHPTLYDLKLEVMDGDSIVDTVTSYFGMRKVHTEANQVFLNNEPLFQRLVLDQGYYKEGIWTAPSDDHLRRDIELAKAAGFNGARLHQKVFEERFHYWADKLGYLTWGESASWGLDYNNATAHRYFLSEWQEIIERDRNHPSIITWTPLNETNTVPKWYIHPDKIEETNQHRRLHVDAYDLTHRLDGTRPVNDASGYIHYKTDLWTVHNYTQDGPELQKELTPDPEKGVWRNVPHLEADYAGQPYLVDEFGGIKWVDVDESQRSNEGSWGYGDGPKSLEEFYARLEGQIEALLSLEHITGYCYTQLTDVEQEQNGIYNYDRSAKFDMAIIAPIFKKTRSRS